MCVGLHGDLGLLDAGHVDVREALVVGADGIELFDFAHLRVECGQDVRLVLVDTAEVEKRLVNPVDALETAGRLLDRLVLGLEQLRQRGVPPLAPGS